MRQATLAGVVEAIGSTPLIRLRRASAATGCEILGKAEFMNPGASVKDRAALFIIRDAEKRGLLRPGGRVVEGTAGNTGIGLAMVARALGYQATIVVPRTQSEEKKDAIRLMGGELVEVDAVPHLPTRPTTFATLAGLPKSWPRLNQPAPCGPISSTTWLTATLMSRPLDRRSGARPAARWTASSVQSAPVARSPGVARALHKVKPDVAIRAGRVLRRVDPTPVTFTFVTIARLPCYRCNRYLLLYPLLPRFFFFFSSIPPPLYLRYVFFFFFFFF